MVSQIADKSIWNQQPVLDISFTLSSFPKEAIEVIRQLRAIIKNYQCINSKQNESLVEKNKEICSLKKRNEELEENNIKLTVKYLNLMKLKVVYFSDVKDLDFFKNNVPESEVMKSDDLETDGSCLATDVQLNKSKLDKTLQFQSKIDSFLSVYNKASVHTEESKNTNFEADRRTTLDNQLNKSFKLENDRLRDIIKKILSRKNSSIAEYLKINNYETTMEDYKRRLKTNELNFKEIQTLVDQKYNLKEILNSALHMEFCFDQMKKLCSEEKKQISELTKEKSEAIKPIKQRNSNKFIKHEPILSEENKDSGFFGSVQNSNKDDNMDSGLCTGSTQNLKTCERCSEEFDAETFDDHQKKCTDEQ